MSCFISCDPSGNLFLRNGYEQDVVLCAVFKDHEVLFEEKISFSANSSFAPAAMGHVRYSNIVSFRIEDMMGNILAEYSAEYVLQLRNVFKKKNDIESWIFTEKGLFFKTIEVSRRFNFDVEKTTNYYRSQEAVDDLNEKLTTHKLSSDGNSNCQSTAVIFPALTSRQIHMQNIISDKIRRNTQAKRFISASAFNDIESIGILTLVVHHGNQNVRLLAQPILQWSETHFNRFCRLRNRCLKSRSHRQRPVENLDRLIPLALVINHIPVNLDKMIVGTLILYRLCLKRFQNGLINPRPKLRNHFELIPRYYGGQARVNLPRLLNDYTATGDSGLKAHFDAVKTWICAGGLTVDAVIANPEADFFIVGTSLPALEGDAVAQAAEVGLTRCIRSRATLTKSCSRISRCAASRRKTLRRSP